MAVQWTYLVGALVTFGSQALMVMQRAFNPQNGDRYLGGLLMRVGEVDYLAWLITKRTSVQIRHPL